MESIAKRQETVNEFSHLGRKVKVWVWVLAIALLI